MHQGFAEKLHRWWKAAAGHLGVKSEEPVNPRLVFERFQRVLASNNEALEIIADLGEKLGGDYLFDSRYIEASVERLTAAVEGSVEAMDLLCGRPLPGLKEAYARLTDEVHLTLSGREDREGPLILALDAIRPRDWARVGGKGAHLAEMRKDLALRAPDGFVISTRSYHALIDHNGLREPLTEFETLMADHGADPARLEELRRRLESAVLAAAPPPGLLEDLAAALRGLDAGEAPLSLAVRSSAQEEDMDFSFAGQFRSVLHVPADSATILAAAREVMASLFAAHAVSYRRRVFPDDGQMAIAVVCQRMVASRTSGIAFSVDTATRSHDTMVVVAAWGQGEAVVEGSTATDTFYLAKGPPLAIVSRHLAVKTLGLFPAVEGGLAPRVIAAGLQEQACLSDEELLELGGQVSRLEYYYKRPQDVEWAIDEAGRLFILQARPLLLADAPDREQALPERLERYELVVAGEGRVAQQGIAAGPVHFANASEDPASVPEGAVLVSRRDSSRFVPFMPRLAAIVTATGTPVSHMATICREFQVPCLVNVAGILDLVREGEVVTVDAEDRRIYRGRVEELLVYRASTSVNIMASREFRLLRKVLKKVSQLHLVDPLMQQFNLSGCRTYHDLLRFIHENAVQEMVHLGRDEGRLLHGSLVRRMDLPIPTGILVIDIGGGLAPDAPANDVPFPKVASVPFRAILQGMLFPEVWHRAPMPVGMRDLMHSMFNPAHDVVARQYSGHNIALIGENYVNLCFRLGYHYNIIDAHCGELERNNHLYFRFLGGVTDMTKRSRRAAMISLILRALDFNVQTRGDLVTARLAHLPRAEAEHTLDILGRLVGFTRQIDVRMENDEVPETFAAAFLQGDYGIVNR